MTEKDNVERQAHLRDYWRLVWRGKWMILAIAVIVSTLVAVATLLQNPIYRATAQVEIQPQAKSINPGSDFSGLGAPSWSWGAEERYLNTQMQVVRSREIAKNVIEAEDLAANPRFAGLNDPAGALAGRIQLKMLLDTYVLEISIEDVDPEIAALLANGVAEAYVDANVDAAIDKARRVIEELTQLTDPMRQQIQEFESRRIELARENAAFVPEAQEANLESRLGQLQRELTEVRIDVGEREAIFQAIEEIERQGGSYLALPVVADDPLVQELSQDSVRLEQEIQELSLSFREGHPKFRAAREALAEIPRKIGEQAEKIIAEIKTQYAIDKRREVDLEEQLRLVRVEGLDLSETTTAITMVDSEIKEERRIYELMTTRIKEIDLNRETLMNNVRILERAIVPTGPVRPRKVLNLGAGMLLGLFLGLGAVFFADYLDNTIKSAEDIERYLNLPLLAVVPKYRATNQESVKEAFQTLRTSILFASKGRSLNTLLVTSAGPGEGKTSTVVHLARALSSAGDRVVLVDCDLRRPTVHKEVGLERAGGLTNYLVSRDAEAGWMRFLKDAPATSGLKVLTCGPLPPNPIELFGQERFLELIGELKRHFDWVLIDSPPVASVSDSIVLGSQVDLTMLVIKHSENDRDMIRNVTAQLRKVEANIVGAVLNNLDLKRTGYYGYYYGSYNYERAEEPADELRTATHFVSRDRPS